MLYTNLNQDNNQIKTIRLGKSIYNKPENGTITDSLQDPELYKKKLQLNC